MNNLEAKQILYSGRVQGVGFRYKTAKIAKDFQVTGFVRNLNDGRVELFAEGTPEELKAFTDSVAEVLAPNIENAQEKTSELKGMKDFSILR